jgi:tetrahydromethanopterin S-methyltransferase subunit D
LSPIPATRAPLFVSIWRSFVALPNWVKVWVFLFLTPVNVASLFFIGAPSGSLVAVLAMGGLAVGTVMLLTQHGFSRLMSAGHIVTWTPLVLLLIIARPEASGSYDMFLTVLLMVNLTSLIFDINDLRLWLQGDRRVIGHN